MDARHFPQAVLVQLALGLIALVCLSSSGTSADALNASNANVRESLSFDPDDEYLFLAVRVADKDYLFAVDTGAINFFDASLQTHLGPRLESRSMITANGQKEMELYRAPEAHVGSLKLAPAGTVGCTDFAPLRESSGCNIRGLIGIDFLKDWIAVMDFDRGRIDFLDPSTTTDKSWGEGIPFVRDSYGLIWVQVTVGEKHTARFLIDTGWRRTGTLDKATSSALEASGEFRTTGTTEIVDGSGRRSTPIGRLSQLSVGAFRSTNLQFSTGMHNILGLNYLRRYRVTIDYSRQRLHLAEGKRFADPDRGSMSGLLFLFQSDRIVIKWVDEKGPAYAAGVRAKDIVREISGRPVSSMTSSEIRRILRSSQGAPVRMSLERAGKPVEVEVTPIQYD
jgi:hypothetical protein